jgi:hypothetical protein
MLPTLEVMLKLQAKTQPVAVIPVAVTLWERVKTQPLAVKL